MENKMAEVAKLLGVELNEEFTLNPSNYKYMLTRFGLYKIYKEEIIWESSSMLQDLLLGKFTIVKIPKFILDYAEKKYLSAVIKPFRNKVYAIAKYDDGDDNYYIQIAIKQNVYFEYIDLPYFKKGTMYKGMELKKEYTVEQLGLQEVLHGKQVNRPLGI